MTSCNSLAVLNKYRIPRIENEKRIIESALESFDWNISRASRELGINRSTLYEKIAKYEISKN